MADRLAEDGFLEAGYNRVHIDDCWMERSRDKHGRLVADLKRFPSGIKELAKYVRCAQGLKKLRKKGRDREDSYQKSDEM
ncbi:hypothetical protein ANCCEY_06703 [Ancylostoma ceylanicum]|uniref:Alpha-galactosidase n=1 Tax=Ancylostoma ceylanicum TaxID=53326 RepID=A0A0D6LQP0_9BILA|nr:hypothetical protein ANCCEY_06703 [Ancylostoma ceylanicum]